MKIRFLDPRFIDVARFNLSAAVYVPARSGCYAITNVYGDVLYIGQSIDLHRRFIEHLSDPRKTRLTTLGLAHWFYYLRLPATRIVATEDSLMVKFKFHEASLPILNKAGP